ncbi:MAG: diguanylate cyclase, partial [Gammaproteobacteria bacterium]|nr:diguanylate cyclase [Gammaproteobacteria bacterium]
MHFFRKGSIRKNLTFLVFLSILPAFAILFYTGFEHRQQIIESTQQDVALIVRGMAEQQREITRSSQQMLTMLSRLPEIRQLNIGETTRILSDLIALNPQYSNMALVDLDGNVLTSGKGRSSVNLADRKHFIEALRSKTFVVGEFIISRVSVQAPVFPSAIPVLDAEGNPRAVLTLVHKLSSFSRYLDTSDVPDGSFVAITDHKGLRMYYYPEKQDTNPVGKPINAKNWEIASIANGPGILTSKGSDGNKRIFAFEPVSLKQDEPPYIYFWSGIPENRILAPANEALLKSLLFLFLALLVAILVARTIGEKIIIKPLMNLVQLAGQLSKGNLEARSDTHSMISEFDMLSHEFNQMAESLQKNNEKLSRLSLVDGLTNIANRRMFDQKLQEEWNRSVRTKRPLSLLLIDIDYFKKFNDAYGHLAGDDCLRTISLILKNIANRSTDLAARYGGEEFAMILPETDMEGAIAIADLIHAQVAQREI